MFQRSFALVPSDNSWWSGPSRFALEIVSLSSFQWLSLVATHPRPFYVDCQWFHCEVMVRENGEKEKKKRYYSIKDENAAICDDR